MTLIIATGVLFIVKRISTPWIQQKASTVCFIRNLPDYCTCICVPNCYWEISHTQSNWCCFMFL